MGLVGAKKRALGSRSSGRGCVEGARFLLQDVVKLSVFEQVELCDEHGGGQGSQEQAHHRESKHDTALERIHGVSSEVWRRYPIPRTVWSMEVAKGLSIAWRSR